MNSQHADFSKKIDFTYEKLLSGLQKILVLTKEDYRFLSELHESILADGIVDNKEIEGL